MFLKYLKPIFEPFQRGRAKMVQAKNVKGNIKVDVNRVKAYKNVAGQHAKKAQQFGGQAQQAGGQAQQVQGAVTGQIPGAGAGQAQEAGAMNPSPIVKSGFLFWKRHLCGNCNQELDKTWDACPYCAQAPAPAPASHKTQAIMLDAAGAGSGMRLLGWIVPLKGAQRGELYTLAPLSSVGTDPTCTVCLSDQYMSSHHAEIKAEGGVWILRDLGSTNGTFVNDKRIEQRELVDNDFVRFGQSLVKFKSL